ncbi:hypothetical protein SORBI_3010G207900 [Sorghum bicolor]|uniref:Uncharacterized protein n=1 Tax=Sorghum bicolor TaxID=4558 RepID=A0A1W0VU56_SORBI|nr:hypothetical protein SORBI_3010G207900 [Sorghum bicolor]
MHQVTSSAATLRPAAAVAAHALRLSTDHREGPKIRARFGAMKFSWTETLNATSPTKATGRHHKHSSVLKVRCWVATHHQHNSNAQRFQATGIGIAKILHAFYQFCRPHTIFGTIIGITSVSLLPVKSLDDFTLTVLWGYLEVPFLRWKQHAFLAAFCIIFVRAVLVQLAFFAHMQQHVLKRPLAPTRSVVFATCFMCCFSAVIALFKDIPDVDGDRYFGIQSMTVRLGQQRVYRLCVNILMTAYAAAILVGASSTNLYQKIVILTGHGLLASTLWQRAQQFDIANKECITPFYMFIWKLFYAEYFLIPFV